MRDLAWSILRTARDATEIAAIAKILQQVCEHLSSQAAIIWEADSSPHSKDSRLSAAGQWFSSAGVAALIDNLPTQSKTWKAIQSGTPVVVPDIDKENTGIVPVPFLQEAQIKSFVSYPFGSTKTGALSLYRTAAFPAFEKEILDRLQFLAPLVYCLCDQVTTNVGTELVLRVARMLDKAEMASSGQTEESMRLFTKELCQVVASTFQATECTLLLSDFAGPNSYSETTWHESPLFKKAIDPSDKEWRVVSELLDKRAAVHTSDIAGLMASQTVRSQVMDALTARVPDRPSMSFIAVPILARQKRVGTLYCFAPQRAPFYFSCRDESLLQRVSVLVGRWWSMSVEARKQLQVFQDLSHQLKSPITQIYHRAQSLLPEQGRPVRYALRALLGLSRKSRKVVLNMRIFAALAAGKGVKATLEPLDLQQFRRMLREAAVDTQILFEDERPRFVLDEATFANWPLSVQIDYNLIEQAVNNLLDNAGKYSFHDENSTVNIVGKVIECRYCLCVINRGIRLHPEDVAACKQRGWRGRDAEAVTGEGSGIGLWLVDNIMKAHDGALEVLPTTTERITEVRLVFNSKR